VEEAWSDKALQRLDFVAELCKEQAEPERTHVRDLRVTHFSGRLGTIGRRSAVFVGLMSQEKT